MKVKAAVVWGVVIGIIGLGFGEPALCQPFTDLGPGLAGLESGSVAWGDFDNDGDLDGAVTGWTGSECVSKVYRNNGLTVDNIGAGITDVAYGAMIWGDYDGDGDLDLAMTGWTGSAPISRIYRNDAGIFTDIVAGLTGVSGSALAWGDYDNDGDLDLALAGWTGSERISCLYRNNAGTFVAVSAGLPGVSNSALAWGDYDNDGDLDLAIAGYTGTVYIAGVFRNTAGTFSDIGAGLAGVTRGSLAWGDFDNDGDLDLAVAGWTGSARISRIYRNNGGAFTDIVAGLTNVADCALAWGDYDNDGDLDLVLAGRSSSAAVSIIYRNNGATFTDIAAGLTGVEYAAVAWGDFDNDGDLDLLLSGNAGADQILRIIRNDRSGANTPPSPPSGLTVGMSGDAVTFSWAAASDAATPAAGLSYNLRVGTAAGGQNVFCGMANPASGWRRVAATGNAQKRLSWTLRGVGAGPFYWSVQAVDSAFAGSAWAGEVCGPDSDGDGDFDATDCAPMDPARHHGAAEICGDGVDNDCNGLTDAADPQCQSPTGDAVTYYRDADGDGYGAAGDSVSAATAPAGYVADNTDCDDGNANVHPGAVELCGDGVDNDCDGVVDGADPDCGGSSASACGACGVGGVGLAPLMLTGILAMRLAVRRKMRGY